MRLGMVSDCVGGDTSRQQQRLGGCDHNWVDLVILFIREGVNVHSNLSDTAVLDVLVQR